MRRGQPVRRGEACSRQRLYHQPRCDDRRPLVRQVAVEGVPAGDFGVRPVGSCCGRCTCERDRYDVVGCAVDHQHGAVNVRSDGGEGAGASGQPHQPRQLACCGASWPRPASRTGPLAQVEDAVTRVVPRRGDGGPPAARGREERVAQHQTVDPLRPPSGERECLGTAERVPDEHEPAVGRNGCDDPRVVSQRGGGRVPLGCGTADSVQANQRRCRVGPGGQSPGSPSKYSSDSTRPITPSPRQKIFCERGNHAMSFGLRVP